MPTTTTIVSAKAAVPFAYRLVLTTIEPVIAALGALQVWFAPQDFLDIVARRAVAYAPPTQFVYTTLGGSWLYFAFVEAVVLRAFDDLALWRLLCAGMLLFSDAAYCHAAAQAVGGWAVFLRVQEWSWEDHLNFWLTAPMVAVRVLVVLGVGLKKDRPGSAAKTK